MGKFAEKLRELMDGKQLTQSALARMAGIKQPSVNNILNNKTIPTIDTVMKLSTALSVEPSELINLALYDEAPPAAKVFFSGVNQQAVPSAIGASLEELLLSEGLNDEDIFEIKQFVSYRKWLRQSAESA